MTYSYVIVLPITIGICQQAQNTQQITLMRLPIIKSDKSKSRIIERGSFETLPAKYRDINQNTILSSIVTRYWLKAGLLYFQISRVWEYEIEEHLLSSTFSSRSFSSLVFLVQKRFGGQSTASCIFWAFFQRWSSAPQRRKREGRKAKEADTRWKRKKRTIDEDEAGRERSLVNARENWLLNLAAGMSAEHPPSLLEERPQPIAIFSRLFPSGPASR